MIRRVMNPTQTDSAKDVKRVLFPPNSKDHNTEQRVLQARKSHQERLERIRQEREERRKERQLRMEALSLAGEFWEEELDREARLWCEEKELREQEKAEEQQERVKQQRVENLVGAYEILYRKNLGLPV